MKRVRLSTTVDAQLLAGARRLVPGPDSRLVDLALAALVEQVEGERELEALAAHPYEADPDVSWPAPAGPDLPYDGPVPADVRRLAQRRRGRSA